MGIVPSAVAALDANEGDALVASTGLEFLADLAEQERNQVVEHLVWEGKPVPHHGVWGT